MKGRNTVRKIQEKVEHGEKLVMVTAYDYPSACLAEQAGVDMILVGDSLGNVVLGYDTTIPVTMEDMLHHTRAVSRAVSGPMVVADMPYGSYHVSVEQAVTNAMRLIQEGGAHADAGGDQAAVVAAVDHAAGVGDEQAHPPHLAAHGHA